MNKSKVAQDLCTEDHETLLNNIKEYLNPRDPIFIDRKS